MTKGNERKIYEKERFERERECLAYIYTYIYE